MDHGHPLVRSSVRRQQCSPGRCSERKIVAQRVSGGTRRRRVIRVLFLYAIAGWLIIQVASTVLPGLNVPAWSVTLVIVLVALGLPLAAILAWAFDVGDGRISRSGAADAGGEAAHGSPVTGAAVPRATDRKSLEKARNRASLRYACRGRRPPLDRRAALRQHERRSGERVLQRRDLRGNPQSPHQAAEAAGRRRGRRRSRSRARTSTCRRSRSDSAWARCWKEASASAGDRVRITAQLIDTKSDSHLWSETYDRKLKDVFAIQDDIAHSIVNALQMTLTPQERLAIQYTATSNPQAYDFYLRGRSYYNTMTKRGFTHALTLYQEAIERDPNYALAFAGIADVYSFLFKYGGATPEIAGRALDASQRAVELDGGLAEAHTSRGLALSINGRHEEAEREFERAIELKPSLYEAYYFYGRDCVSQGRSDKAAGLFAQAVAINPDYYEAFPFLATVHRKTGRLQEAMDADRRGVAAAEKHLEMYPDDARALYLGSGALMATGDAVRATEWAERALEAAPDEPSVLYNVGCMYSMMGNKERAIALVDEAVRKGSATARGSSRTGISTRYATIPGSRRSSRVWPDGRYSTKDQPQADPPESWPGAILGPGSTARSVRRTPCATRNCTSADWRRRRSASAPNAPPRASARHRARSPMPKPESEAPRRPEREPELEPV